MDNKFYVPFNTAKRLKEAGYNEPSTMVYNNLGELWSIGSVPRRNESNDIRQRVDINHITAPTYHEAVDWLEKKGYYVCTLHFEQGWSAIVNMVYVNKQRYASRENALRLAIKYVLDKLEKGGAQ